MTALTNSVGEPLLCEYSLKQVNANIIHSTDLQMIKLIQNQRLVPFSVRFVNQNLPLDPSVVHHFEILIRECGSRILENMAFVIP